MSEYLPQLLRDGEALSHHRHAAGGADQHAVLVEDVLRDGVDPRMVVLVVRCLHRLLARYVHKINHLCMHVYMCVCVRVYVCVRVNLIQALKTNRSYKRG